ncbi:transposase [Lactococcus fujiensis]|uniref:transposase n=1 Tax=Lactococcus fujiensis TaxID=610251 RepID=UPI000AA262ED|nr:transposase [Lactococcus fujiensis]
MTKYSFELKLKVVQNYDNGVGGCDYLAKKYHVTNEAIVRRWVKAYKELGAVGIQRKRQNTVYSTQFKLNAVNLYLTSEKSYRELAHELGMNNPPLLTRWVSNYRKKRGICLF